MSIDQRFHTEKLQREIAAMKASPRQAEKELIRLRVPPKPAVAFSCWDDPKFVDRVLAKAERHAAILAEIRSPNWMKESLTPKQQWDKAVEKIMEDETGGDKSAALKIAAKRYRGVLNQMRLQANR